MKPIKAGVTGHFEGKKTSSWEDLRLQAPWLEVVRILNPGTAPRSIQTLALGKERVLENRRNLLISAPTNSGKTLIGLLVLLDAARRGKRAVLLEPLRALAREKADELQVLAPQLAAVLGCPLSIHLSTGDYRLENEAFTDPPPHQGELIIATPERFEAILRNPAYDKWINSIEAVCVDEAHLLGSVHRGPTLEFLLTTLLCLPAPPRLVLLSASIKATDRLQEWLSPCDAICTQERASLLHKEIWALEEDEEANEIVAQQAHRIVANPQQSVLIFVYQTASADTLAKKLNDDWKEAAQVGRVLSYHARLSAARREEVRQAFLRGECRCIVTTTALGLGMNLPATHVILRDNTFPGVGKLSLSEILQMMGRAGRGTQEGSAAILVRTRDGWKAEELADALRREQLPEIISVFEAKPKYQEGAPDRICTFANSVAALLAREPERGMTLPSLQQFFSRSLGGSVMVAQIPTALSWLSDPVRVLAFRDKHERYRLTTLGLQTVRAVFPLSMASGIAQLLRDLLTIDSEDKLLASWKPLDHLLVLELVSERLRNLRLFSQELAEQVDGWMEQHPDQTPLLYRHWIRGHVGKSRAVEIFGSLNVSVEGQQLTPEESARRRSYIAALQAIVLFERGEGQTSEELERRWKIRNLEGIEEKWRDEMLWLLSGLAKLLDVRCFYFHLREECQADAERIQRVKRHLRTMQMQIFSLQTHLKYCSPLGGILRAIRRTQTSTNGIRIGVQSIRRLEEAGVRKLNELIHLQVEDFTKMGVRPDLAQQIRRYAQKRLR